MATSTKAKAATPTTTFTRAEQRALRVLRTRYRQDCDLFSPRERTRLHFVRWLYQTGRLTP